MLLLEILNYMGDFHLWPTLYFYWIEVALRFNNSFSSVETVYWKEKKKPILFLDIYVCMGCFCFCLLFVRSPVQESLCSH